MGRCCPLGPKMLDVFLLLSASIVSHTAADPRLYCVNDYVFTINCSLTEASEEVAWLYISDDLEQTTWCRLREVDGGHFCSINISSLVSDESDLEPLNDLQSFQMWLCGSQDAPSINTCRLLIEEYTPQNHIKPSAPCCLRLSRNFSRHHFSWRSSFEEYRHFTALSQNMQYQLQYYGPGQGSNIFCHEPPSCFVSDENLLPGVEYGARVRSRPNQVKFRGEWSDWSSEIHWRTEPEEPDVISTSFLSRLGIEHFLLCVMALLLFLLLLSFACVKMWRRAYIPTPAPYFHTLYNDYHGDFKSWVVTRDKTADGQKVEEILQTDTVTKCVDVQELGPRPLTPPIGQEQEATYSNICPPGGHSSLPGVPYAVSSAVPAEDSSGCWMCSRQGLESSAPLHSKEYCTLSAFQQSHSCSRGAASEQHAEYQN